MLKKDFSPNIHRNESTLIDIFSLTWSRLILYTPKEVLTYFCITICFLKKFDMIKTVHKFEPSFDLINELKYLIEWIPMYKDFLNKPRNSDIRKFLQDFVRLSADSG